MKIAGGRAREPLCANGAARTLSANRSARSRRRRRRSERPPRAVPFGSRRREELPNGEEQDEQHPREAPTSETEAPPADLQRLRIDDGGGGRGLIRVHGVFWRKGAPAAFDRAPGL